MIINYLHNFSIQTLLLQFKIGKTINIKIDDTNNPPITPTANAYHILSELSYKTRGNNPTIVVSVVIRMGRIR